MKIQNDVTRYDAPSNELQEDQDGALVSYEDYQVLEVSLSEVRQYNLEYAQRELELSERLLQADSDALVGVQLSERLVRQLGETQTKLYEESHRADQNGDYLQVITERMLRAEEERDQATLTQDYMQDQINFLQTKLSEVNFNALRAEGVDMFAKHMEKGMCDIRYDLLGEHYKSGEDVKKDDEGILQGIRNFANSLRGQ